MYSGEGDLVERRDDTEGSTRYASDAAHRLATERDSTTTIAITWWPARALTA